MTMRIRQMPLEQKSMWESRFLRVFSILAMLSPHSQETLYTLARQLECDESQIRRDIAILKSCGLAVYVDGEGHVRIMAAGYKRIVSWMRLGGNA